MSQNIIANSSVAKATNFNNSNNTEFRVDTTTGEAYISQRKAAELLGISRDSLKSYIERNLLHPGESDISQGLSSEIFNVCTQYYALDARNPTSEAKALLRQITAAGVKAYLYAKAGYVMSASLPSAEPVVPSVPLLPTQIAYADLIVYKDVLELLGVTGNAAILGANQAVATCNGIDLLERVGKKHLIQPEQVEVLNVTDLGKRIGLKAIATNLKLEVLGLQAKIDGKWVLTDTGKSYGVLLDTSKKLGVGTPVLQLKWKESVLELLK
jgi:hypothetical protein